MVVVGGEDEPRNYELLYNPRIVATAETLAKGDEGSVALPGARAILERPVWADIAFMDHTGTPHTRRFDAFLARVVLHEIEQMQGIFFLDRLSRLQRERAMKKAKKLKG